MNKGHPHGRPAGESIATGSGREVEDFQAGRGVAEDVGDTGGLAFGQQLCAEEGDGIQDVQCTPDGVIRASYFDEGVFGNDGWDAPLGSAGLVARDIDGNVRYEFEPPTGLDSIADGYALNAVDERDVWCSYYPEFPIVHIRDGRAVRSWRSPVEGSSAFAVGSAHVLIRGGYQNGDAFSLCTLRDSGHPRVLGEFRAADERGHALTPTDVVGRGSVLHLLDGGKSFRLDIAAALAAA